ncbi:hypothetical protein HDU96_001848 [Phlyctochytrium bullatum]|nr:hypothetical protein HDU96_001848 [Phlyctochytrium bullatum]
MLRTLLTSSALLVALIPAAFGKMCLYHYDSFAKSIFLWDAQVQDYSVCNYWNWHYFNLPGFTDIVAEIGQVCYKPECNEMGFMLFTLKDNSPDRVFMPDGGECGYIAEQHMPEFLAALEGWTCLNVYELDDGCSQQGNPIFGRTPIFTVTADDGGLLT